MNYKLYHSIFIVCQISCIAADKETEEEDSAIEEIEENNDVDGDGYEIGEDCNDNNAAIHPAAEEVCDGLDNNCDEAMSSDGCGITALAKLKAHSAG